MIFYGSIKGGKLILDHTELANNWISTQPDQRVCIEIDKFHPEKSHAQLKYYFGVIIKLGAESFGYTKDEMDGILCTMFLKRNTKDGRVYIKSKSELNTKEMAEFIESCIRFLSMEGIIVPPAIERGN